MRAPRTLPRHRLLAVFLAVAGVASIIGGAAVGALEGERFVVSENQPGGGTYGPIPVSDPATVTTFGAFVTPDDCRALPSCMNVPFTVEVPAGLKKQDEFYADIAVAWDDPEHLSDVDVFVWDNKQQRKEEGKSDGYTVQTDSASAANPEVARLYKPSYGDYNLVIINFAGPPVTVDVAGKLIVARFTTPFELLAPEPNRPAPARERAAITPTTQAPSQPEAQPTATPDTSPAQAPVLPEIDVQSDADFDNFEDPDFEESLLPELTDEDLSELAALAQQISSRSDAPPSGLALLLSLVVGPVLLLSAVGTWLWRRSPAAIAID